MSNILDDINTKLEEPKAYNEFTIGKGLNDIVIIIHEDNDQYRYITIRDNGIEVVINRKINRNEPILLDNQIDTNAKYKVIKIPACYENIIDVDFPYDDRINNYLYNNSNIHLFDPNTVKPNELNIVTIILSNDPTDAYGHNLNDEEMKALNFVLKNWNTQYNRWINRLYEQEYNEHCRETMENIIKNSFNLDYELVFDRLELTLQHNFNNVDSQSDMILDGVVSKDVNGKKPVHFLYSLNDINNIWIESTINS